jgi:hypothetical protein
MKLRKKINNEEDKKYWEYVEEISKEVEETYPDWKKGGEKINHNTPSGESQRLGGSHESPSGNGYHFT